MGKSGPGPDVRCFPHWLPSLASHARASRARVIAAHRRCTGAPCACRLLDGPAGLRAAARRRRSADAGAGRPPLNAPLNAPSQFRRERNHVANPRARAKKKCSLAVRHESNLTKTMLPHGSARANTTSPAPTRRRARRIFSPSRLRREGKSQKNLTWLTRLGSAPWRSAPDIFGGDGVA